MYVYRLSPDVSLVSISLRDRDRDGRSERERIRLFREREEKKHLMRKRHWLEVPSVFSLSLSVILLTFPASGCERCSR